MEGCCWLGIKAWKPKWRNHLAKGGSAQTDSVALLLRPGELARGNHAGRHSIRGIPYCSFLRIDVSIEGGVILIAAVGWYESQTEGLVSSRISTRIVFLVKSDAVEFRLVVSGVLFAGEVGIACT